MKTTFFVPFLFGTFLWGVIHTGCGGRNGGTTGAQCGNNVAEGNEQCDGVDLGGTSCNDLGYSGGQLVCGADCTFDTGACSTPITCGDGVIQLPEECDGADLGGATCELLGAIGGDLQCGPGCSFDRSSCLWDVYCGDGFVEPGYEECDAGNLNGETCQTRGYASGILLCDNFCIIDDAWCTDGECENRFDDNGNGLVDCEDTKCSGRFGCAVEVCGDAVDNDGNGMTDCEDFACATNAPSCNAGCWWTENAAFGNCDDGVDNDCDGQSDGQDPDCQSDPFIMLVHDTNGSPVMPGDVLIYSITVYALGGPLTSGTVVNVVDSRLTNVQVLDGGSFDAPSQTATWNLPAIAQSTTVTVHLVATVDPQTPGNTQICNQADADFGTAWVSDNPDVPGFDDPTCVTTAP